MSEQVGCSSCGARDVPLDVVTMLYNHDLSALGAGRLLVYCDTCRSERWDRIGLSIPHDLMNEEMFVELYRLGRTASEPHTAVDIVFGESEPDLVSAATRAGIAAGMPMGPQE